MRIHTHIQVVLVQTFETFKGRRACLPMLLPPVLSGDDIETYIGIRILNFQ